MKQVVSFLLAVMLFVGSLLPRMSAEQVAHLPELLTHYQQHQREEGNNFSLWTFLLDHYLTDSPHHKTPCHSHNRLPSFDSGSSTYDFMQSFRFIYEPFVTELASAAVFKVPLLNARQAFSSLLQPPRY